MMKSFETITLKNDVLVAAPQLELVGVPEKVLALFRRIL
jgi:hypothetical protein